MENDLISRSALIAYVKELPTWEATNRGFFAKRFPSGFFAPDDIVKSIQYAPAVDAVPVVRCKDCKWLYRNSEMCCCKKHTGLAAIKKDGSDFCSYGERRNDV